MSLAPILIINLGIAVIAYVHYRVLSRNRYAASLVLGIVGAGFAWLCLLFYPPSSELAVFVSAFAVVHLPALAILLIKAKRHKELRQ